MELINLVQSYRQCARGLKDLHERTNQDLVVCREQLALAHSELSKERTNVENERNTYQLTLHELKCKLNAVQAELDSANEAITVLQKTDESVIDARSRVNDEKRKSQDLRKQYTQAEAEWEACRSVLLERVKFLEEQSEELCRDLKQTSDSLHSARATVSSLESEKRSLENEMRSLEGKLKQNENHLNSVLEGSRKEQNESLEQIVSLTEQLHAARIAQVIFRAEFERVSSQLSSVEHVLVGLRESEALLKQALSTRVSENSDIASLQSELNSTKSELVQCRAELTDQRRDVLKLQQQKIHLKKQRAELVKLIRNKFPSLSTYIGMICVYVIG